MTRKTAAQRGSLLIEVIVYLAIFALVLGMATEAFYQTWTTSKIFRTDSDEIARSMEAGERWRADVRASIGAIAGASANGGETFRIPQAGGEVVYTFAHGELRRRPVAGREAVELSNIASSDMRMEQKDFGTVCRWELELAVNKRHHALVRPLFSFAAVATGGKSQ